MKRRAAATLLLSLALLPALAAAQPVPPHATFSFPEALVAGEPVDFTDQSMSGNATIVAWAWTFGDGAQSSSRNPSHTYGESGDYTVTLTVLDESGLSDADTQQVSIGAAPGVSLRFPSWLYWAMPAASSTVLVFIGCLVLFRGQPLVYNRVFFFLCMTSAVKGYTEGPLVYFGAEPTAALAGTLSGPLTVVNVLTAFVYAPVFLWFVLVFPRPIRPWLKNGARGAWTLVLVVPFLLLWLNAGDWFYPIFNVYVSFLTLTALGLLVYHAWETDSHEERHRLRLLAATFFIVVFNTILLSILDVAAARAAGENHLTTAQTYEELGNVFGTIIAPVLEIIGLMLVMYGILRYQLLGVERLVRKITRGAMFAGSTFLTFVIVGNTAEYFIEGYLLQGIPVAFLIAGFIAALMMYPIQKWTERLADRFFPEATSEAPDYLASRRMEIYEAQLRYALLDGQLKSKELQMLHALRESIGLNAQELQGVAQKFPGLDIRQLLSAPATPTA